MLIEKMIITHCSPTLAFIKTGNLFTLKFENKIKFKNEIQSIQEKVKNTGVKLKLLNIKETTALVYVYRKTLLTKELQNQKVKDFLKTYGYENCELEYVLNKLDERIQLNNDFPHEIGVFLGYPLEDVKAFIKNKGKNYNHCGYWKVYVNTHESLKKFELFDKCRNVYQKMWKNGRSISQLTVVA